MNRRLGPLNLLVVFVEALLISWALMFLAEEFGWHLAREAGGSAARSKREAANELKKGLPPPPSSAWQGNQVNAAPRPAEADRDNGKGTL
jgi:hypothetical protein